MAFWISVIFWMVSAHAESIDVDNLKTARITVNGASWRIDAARGSLPLKLSIESKYAGRSKRKKALTSWSWNSSQTELYAVEELQGMTWHIRALATESQLQFEIEVSGDLDRRIEFERLWIDTEAKNVSHLGRDYRWHKLRRHYVIDRWTPQLVSFESDSQAYRLQADAQSVWLEKRSRARVAIELDHYKNHPLKLYSKCFDGYAIRQKESRKKRYSQPASFKRKASFVVHFNHTPVLAPLRYPNRFKSALVFTDHADRSNVARLKALMLGSSSGSQSQRLGFAGHGLSMSKSIFVKAGEGFEPQGSSVAYVQALERIQEKSSQDIGLHSVSGGKDSRSVIESGLSKLLHLQPKSGSRFWIDHQPSTNCEAISNEGSALRKGSRSKYAIVDLLKDEGYGYVWAGFDSRSPKDGINLFDPKRPKHRVPILYSHTGIDASPEPLLVFSSLWRATPLPRFLRSYSSGKLDRLVQDRGLHIAHTYLDAYDYGPSKRYKTLLRKKGDGYVLRPKAEKLFAELARRQQNKDIWVTGISAVGNHLMAMSDIVISSQPNGTLILLNNSSDPVLGASFLLDTDMRIWVDSKPLDSAHWNVNADGNLVFQMDFQPFQKRILSFGTVKTSQPSKRLAFDVGPFEKP